MKLNIRKSQAALVTAIISTVAAAIVSAACSGGLADVTQTTVVNSISPTIEYDSTYVSDTLQPGALKVRDVTGQALQATLQWTSSNPAILKVIGSGQSTPANTEFNLGSDSPLFAVLGVGDAVVTAVPTGDFLTSAGADVSFHAHVSITDKPASMRVLPAVIPTLQVFSTAAISTAQDAAIVLPTVVYTSATGRAITTLRTDWTTVDGEDVAGFCSIVIARLSCNTFASQQKGEVVRIYGLKIGTAHLKATMYVPTGRTLTPLSTIITVNVGGGQVLLSNSPSKNTFDVGSTTQLTALVKDLAGNAVSNPSITWSTSRSGIATVNQSGNVTAVSASADGDTVTVLATVPSLGITGKFPLTIVRRIAAATITPSPVTVGVLEFTRVIAHPTDASGNPIRVFLGTPTWTGTGTTINVPASTDTSNVIAGLAVGDGSVTIRFDNGITASAPVHVVHLAKKISLQYVTGGVTTQIDPPQQVVLHKGSTAQVIATVKDVSNAEIAEPIVFSINTLAFTLASSSANSATVTGVTVGGSGVLTATSSSDPTVQVSVTIVVDNALPTGGAATKLAITSNPVSATTGVGGTVQYTANVTDANGLPASGCTVGWNTDLSSVGSINSSGLATGVGAGATAVRASCNGSNVGSAAKLTVTDGTFGVTKIAITPKKYDFVEVGSISQFAAVVTQNAAGATAPVTWSLDAAATTAGVIIDQTGKITIPATLTGGGATITAKAGGQSDIAWVSYGFAGSVRGTITSTSGRYLSGSSATATPTLGGAPVTSTVDDNGQFYLVGLAPGSYTVFVTEQGVQGQQQFNNVIVTRGNITPIVLTAFPIVHEP